MQDYEQACAAMCIKMVLHTACFEMYVTRVDTYFITWTCFSLTACMDGSGEALNGGGTTWGVTKCTEGISYQRHPSH